MIAMIQPLAVGNALRVFLEAPANALKLRLLRKVADTFTGQDDAGALLVSDVMDRCALDVNALVNSTLYYYRAYYLVGASWTNGPTVSATPAATYQDAGGDVLSLVRDRFDLGLQVELARGVLSHRDGHIPVLTAPPTYDETKWPVVTVHLSSEAPGERGTGETLLVDQIDDDSDWTETEGWLANTQLTIMGWSLNPDERIDLRKALRRIAIANLPVFDDAGMVEIVFSQSDSEDFTQYSAAVYQVVCQFSCMAPVLVGSDVGAIESVTSTLVE